MATNRIDILDPALLRPGRIDRKIEFPAPSEEARLDILKIHSRKMNLTRGINLRKIAEMMPGASGAEVKVISSGNLSLNILKICLGCLHRGWYVCSSRTTCPCHTRRFRIGCCEGKV